MAVLSCFLVSVDLLAESSLYVYVPTDIRANVLQEQLSNICPELKVLVFGRGQDFRKEVDKTQPEAIISLLTVITRTQSYTTIARGLIGGLPEEDYVLVSLDKPVDVAQIDQFKIGVLDVLGRKPMTAFVSDLFKKKVKIKRVTKQEDLLPLLSFGAVEAILIPQSLYENISSKSNLNLVPTSVNIKLGLASAALGPKGEVRKQFAECVSKFDNNLNSILGVDQWKLL
tara:strand:- start:24538 stop:25221 length:684 start_codon:yes stop_codon:yes gene_type:complete